LDLTELDVEKVTNTQPSFAMAQYGSEYCA